MNKKISASFFQFRLTLVQLIKQFINNCIVGLIVLFSILILGQLSQMMFFPKKTINQEKLIQELHITSNNSVDLNNNSNNTFIPKLLSKKWEEKDIPIVNILPITISNNSINQNQNNDTPLVVQGVISENKSNDRILILKNSDGIHYDYYKKGDTLPTGEKIITILTKFVEVSQIVDNGKLHRKKIPFNISEISEASNPLNSMNIVQ